ncbi:hypothetical protein AB6A40_005322 [Gnathostoma spinigerum]|uniref:Progestin and adipoQ receptor family member 3 n=1 Tax=Gnathostoma spinigerum TaxID=75299 RepID=A0ABD6ENQ6_9BILA
MQLTTKLCADRSLLTDIQYELVTSRDLDEALWINEYVHTCYRPPNLPSLAYIRSLFQLNNETINIWSHLLGFLYFSWCQYEVNVLWLPYIEASQVDHFVMTLSILGAQICMFFSACYHTFGCASVIHRQRWLKLDIFGITAGLIAMYLIGIYTAFYCFEQLLNSYLSLLMALFVITAYIPSREEFLKSRVLGSRIGYLHLIYILVVLFGLCPTLHWISVHGGLSNEHVMDWLPSIGVLYLISAFAFLFYATLVPERFSPGTFDVIGCSHQWWHLLILFAMIYWNRSGLQLLTVLRTSPNFCQFTKVRLSRFNETM